MLPHKVITPPTIKPFDVDATLKKHMRLSENDTSEDDLIGEYINAAVEYTERYIGYPLMTQVIEVETLVRPKVRQDLTGNVNDVISYTIDGGSEINGSDLEVETYGILSRVENTEWPSGTIFKFKCNAGYTQATIPSDLKQAIRMLVTHMYECREPTKMEAPDTVIDRLDRHLLY